MGERDFSLVQFFVVIDGHVVVVGQIDGSRCFNDQIDVTHQWRAERNMDK